MIVSKEKKELATIPYQAISKGHQDKELTKAISKIGFQANQIGY